MTDAPALPDPEAVRLPPLPGSGTRPVKWELVDPLLRVVGGAGGMKLLSEKLGISRKTLWMRRTELGLAPLPNGRPTKRDAKLTEVEEDVMERIKGGATKAEVAEARGVTRQAVAGVVARAEAKGNFQAFIDSRCSRCRGSGLVDCTCGTAGPHAHLCPACGGGGARR